MGRRGRYPSNDVDVRLIASVASASSRAGGEYAMSPHLRHTNLRCPSSGQPHRHGRKPMTRPRTGRACARCAVRRLADLDDAGGAAGPLKVHVATLDGSADKNVRGTSWRCRSFLFRQDGPMYGIPHLSGANAARSGNGGQ